MEECIFCRIANHKEEADIVYENDNFICFHDVNPSAPVHVLIVPKKHLEWQSVGESDKEVLGEIFLIAPEIAKKLGVYKSGYNLAMNCGEGAGQVIDHFHVHLLANK